MSDVVTTKFFRNGGSFAVRIPSGWLNPDIEVQLVRDPKTGRVYLNQGGPLDPSGFLDFMDGQAYLPDPAFAQVALRDEQPRGLEPQQSGDR